MHGIDMILELVLNLEKHNHHTTNSRKEKDSYD